MRIYSGFLAAAVLLFLSADAQCQSITITSPNVSTTVREGDDYATNVLGNAWDFLQERDIGWEENFTGASVGVANGIWSGTNEVAGGYVLPLFPGFKGSLFSEGLQGDLELPRFGINHKIDTTKYTQLAFKLNNSARSTLAVYWSNDESKPEYWPDGSLQGATIDGFYHNSTFFPRSGFNIYNYDMSNLASGFEVRSGSWSGNVFALRLDPSVAGGVGATTQFDWIRLVDPNSAPTVNINWNSVGLNPSRLVTVYVDNDNAGFDGIPLARFTSGSDPGTYALKSAILPPGTWYFYVESANANGGGGFTMQARSGYSAPLVINTAPNGYFTAPTQLSGEDFAETIAGNAWDMDGPTDVPNLNPALWPNEWRQFSNQSFAGGLFQATADPPRVDLGNTESDAQVHLNVPVASPIDTNRFRYLSYRVAIDETAYPTMHDKVSRGWVMRPVWWGASGFAGHGRNKAHVLYSGWNTYVTDMADNSNLEYGTGWQAMGTATNFRVDPLETTIPTWFYLDWVKLTGDNRSLGSYQIKWNIGDADNGSFTVKLYYDGDAAGFDGQQITQLNNLSAGAGSFTWDTSALPNGSKFFIYLEVSDGTNTKKFYSPVPVFIGPYVPAPRLASAKLDFDGDGKSDPVVYRMTTSQKRVKVGRKYTYQTNYAGTYYVNRSTAGGIAVPWGNANYSPTVMDIDGDDKADIGLVIPTVGNALMWWVNRSTNGIAYGKTFGLAGDVLVPSDYNGNGMDELAVFRNGTWFVLNESDQISSVGWGMVGDVPVPADYDGDGKTDYAVFRPSDGTWWILYSGYSQGYASNYYGTFQWGLNGDIPLAADHNRDGKAELIVYRPGEGRWYVRNTVDDSTASIQWGLPSFTPMAGTDFNGDGYPDLLVIDRNPLTGGTYWYVNYYNGFNSPTAGSTMIPYGLVNDRIIKNGLY